MTTPSILLVEDHTVVAKALSRVLQMNGAVHISAVAGTAEDALQRLPALKVDLVLIDVSLPKMSGIELVAAIREKYPDLPCLVLSGHVSSQYVQRSLHAGARGYVIKDNPGGILEGIEHVLQGEVYISKELQDQ
jgi:DNA-binding NarL/FixJ family response regulator